MRRDVAGDRQAGRLRPADQIERPGGREVGQVQPGARHVAARRRRGPPGRARPPSPRPPTGQPRRPEDRRDEAVVRLGAVGQGRVLGVIDDRQPERAGVGQRRPQDRRRADRRRRRPRTRRRRHRPARRAPPAAPLPARPSPPRGRAARPATRTRRAAARTAASTPGSSSVGRRVRHRADGREATVRGRGQPARDRLGILVAGLAQVGVEVDEAGRDDDPVRRRSRRRRRPSSQVTASRIPSRTTISPGPSRPAAGSTSQARLISRSGAATAHAAPVRRDACPAEQVEQRHPDRHAVRDLVGDDRLGAGRHVGGDLDALVHRPRVHDQRARPRERQPLARSARSGPRIRAATAAAQPPSARAGSAGP